MYLDHFGLAEPPFRITPHTEFFFSGANRGATLEALLYAATHEEGIVKISGEVGSGKTMLCRVLMERLPKHVNIVYLCNPSLSRDDILYAIADELGLALPEDARTSAVLKVLQNHLISLYGEGRRVVVLIDEAHAMPVETLEEIRLLSNLESNHNKLLQLVLFGQPELNAVLARADMRQLKERITHNFALEPLVRDDVAEYLEFRMRAAGYKGPNVFSPAATKLIFDASKGLSRRINILADKSLLSAFAEGTHQITAKEVRAAIRDSDFSTATAVEKQGHKKLVIVVAAIGLGVLLLVGSILYWKPAALPNPPQVATTAPKQLSTPLAESQTSPPASDTRPTSSPATVTAAANAQSGSSPGTNADGATAPAKAPASRIDQALERTQTWLAAASDERWFIQLYAVDEEHTAKVDSYLKRLEQTESIDSIHVYRSDLSGRMRLGVIFGDYPSRGAAQAAIASLPAWVKATKPYPRAVKKLR